MIDWLAWPIHPRFACKAKTKCQLACVMPGWSLGMLCLVLIFSNDFLSFGVFLEHSAVARTGGSWRLCAAWPLCLYGTNNHVLAIIKWNEQQNEMNINHLARDRKALSLSLCLRFGHRNRCLEFQIFASTHLWIEYTSPPLADSLVSIC